MLSLDISGIQLTLRASDGLAQVFDPVRRRWFLLTPEEHVRQYTLQLFIQKLHYPAGMLSVEKQIEVNGMARRFDIVVYDRKHQPWMLVECKAPEIPLSGETLRQLLHYQGQVRCRYWLMTNGHQAFCADAADIHSIKWLEQLPAYDL
ncbi:MAG: type I restriction enzyme HsdR N-terminal domain-containing protein [Flavipsychrobacter sp.]|nr:type I restriction enzyme HsdR N-terminal domain-containing protein [Flavipsychrobacter sp.]